MPAHVLGIDSDRHPCKGASTATVGQVLKALGSDGQSWVSVAGDVTGSPDALQVTDLTIAGEAHGDLLYRGASAWLHLAAGTSGQLLQTNGAGAAPSWASVATSSLTGTSNLSWTVNNDRTAAVDEDPALYLEGGDGVAAPNNDIVRTSLIQDSSAEVAYMMMERSRNGGGFAKVTPVLQIGQVATTNLNATLRFTAGNGSASGSLDATYQWDGAQFVLFFTGGTLACEDGGSSTRFGERAAANVNGISMGYSANAGQGGTALGTSASTSSVSNATTVGASSAVTGGQGVNLGANGSVSVTAAINIGYGGSVTAAGINIGPQENMSTAGLFNVGSASLPISIARIGKGATSSTPAALTITGTDATGTNISAANITLDLPRGTGTGAGGDFVIRTAPPGSSGTSAGTLAERFRVTDTGEVGIGNVGASPAADVHVLKTTASALVLLLDQDGGADAFVRFDGASESWIAGQAQSQANDYRIAEATTFGTNDRLWINPNEGSFNFAAHSSGIDGAQFQMVTRKVTVTDATVTDLWTLVLSDRYSATAFAIVTAESDTGGAREAASYMLASGARRLNSGNIAQLGGSTVIHSGEDDATWNATFDVDTGTQALRLRIKGNDTDSTTFVATIFYQLLPL